MLLSVYIYIYTHTHIYVCTGTQVHFTGTLLSVHLVFPWEQTCFVTTHTHVSNNSSVPKKTKRNRANVFFLRLDRTRSYLLSLFQHRVEPPLLTLSTPHRLPTSFSKSCSSDVRARTGDGGGRVRGTAASAGAAGPGASASPGSASPGCCLPTLPAPRGEGDTAGLASPSAPPSLSTYTA